ncbi:hypothetical protein C8R44DRAFT_735141 [Mycena epipterygia]|nr:hypothetical protein C8R44DRAFT_735141 [Mycena epipterygia]
MDVVGIKHRAGEEILNFEGSENASKSRSLRTKIARWVPRRKFDFIVRHDHKTEERAGTRVRLHDAEGGAAAAARCRAGTARWKAGTTRLRAGTTCLRAGGYGTVTSGKGGADAEGSTAVQGGYDGAGHNAFEGRRVRHGDERERWRGYGAWARGMICRVALVASPVAIVWCRGLVVRAAEFLPHMRVVSWEVVVERSGANVAAHAVRAADSRLRDVRGFDAHRRASESGRRCKAVRNYAVNLSVSAIHERGIATHAQRLRLAQQGEVVIVGENHRRVWGCKDGWCKARRGRDHDGDGLCEALRGSGRVCKSER